MNEYYTVQYTDKLRDILNRYEVFDVITADAIERGLKYKECDRIKAQGTSAAARELQQVNILVIGEPGVGKSSLISTISRACLQDYGNMEPCAAIHEDHYTPLRRRRAYPVNVNGNIVVYDTPGLDNLMVKDQQAVMAMLTQREIGVDVQEKAEVSIYDQIASAILLDARIASPDKATVIDVPHAIIVVLDATQEKIPVEMAHLIRILLSMRYHPIFVITKVDIPQVREVVLAKPQKEKQVNEMDVFEVNSKHMDVNEVDSVEKMNESSDEESVKEYAWVDNFQCKRNEIHALCFGGLSDDILYSRNYLPIEFEQGITIESIEAQAIKILKTATRFAEKWLIENHYTKRGWFSWLW